MSNLRTDKIDQLFKTVSRYPILDEDLVRDARSEYRRLKDVANSKDLTRTIQSNLHKARAEEKWTTYSELAHKLRNELAKAKQQVREKESENLALRRQLGPSKDLSKSDLFADNPNITDLSDPHRPLVIKDQYIELYDNEWTDLYECLKGRGWEEVDILVTLQRILRASYDFCFDVSKEQLENIEAEALCPTATWTDDVGIVQRNRSKIVTKEIRNLARKYRKSTAMDCLPTLQQAYIKNVLPTFIDADKYNEKHLYLYTRKCVEISWFMCLQEPPMAFISTIDRGSKLDTRYFRCYSKTGDKCDYLVWPALLLHKDGPIMIKGVVQPIKAENKNLLFQRRQKKQRSQRKSLIPVSYGDDDLESRNPEDFVDLSMDSEEEQIIKPEYSGPLGKRTPSSDVQRPGRKSSNPSAPFFRPYAQKQKQAHPQVPKIELDDVLNDDDDDYDTETSPSKRTHMSSPRQTGKDTTPRSKDPYPSGRLTVLWKNRQTSAP